jgi:hypothetical protein
VSGSGISRRSNRANLQALWAAGGNSSDRSISAWTDSERSDRSLGSALRSDSERSVLGTSAAARGKKESCDSGGSTTTSGSSSSSKRGGKKKGKGKKGRDNSSSSLLLMAAAEMLSTDGESSGSGQVSVVATEDEPKESEEGEGDSCRKKGKGKEKSESRLRAKAKKEKEKEKSENDKSDASVTPRSSIGSDAEGAPRWADPKSPRSPHVRKPSKRVAAADKKGEDEEEGKKEEGQCLNISNIQSPLESHKGAMRALSPRVLAAVEREEWEGVDDLSGDEVDEVMFQYPYIHEEFGTATMQFFGSLKRGGNTQSLQGK